MSECRRGKRARRISHDFRLDVGNESSRLLRGLREHKRLAPKQGRLYGSTIACIFDRRGARVSERSIYEAATRARHVCMLRAFRRRFEEYAMRDGALAHVRSRRRRPARRVAPRAGSTESRRVARGDSSTPSRTHLVRNAENITARCAGAWSRGIFATPMMETLQAMMSWIQRRPVRRAT